MEVGSKDKKQDTSEEKDNNFVNSRNEYFNLLEKWMNNVYIYQNLAAAYPYYLMCNQISQINQINSFRPTEASSGRSLNNPFYSPLQNPFVARQNIPTSEQGLQCHIPPLWKRLAAELLDFFVLFFLKVLITFVVVDFFDLIDLHKFDFDILHKDLKYDTEAAIQVLYEIVILEGIHRLVVCTFETFWLQSEFGQRLGGATPGKSIIGLRVITCDRVTPLQGDEVLVFPGKNLTVTRAFLRSFLKNLVHAIFIPASLGFLYFRYNRFGYDVLCGTVVIEDSPSIRGRLHQQF